MNTDTVDISNKRWTAADLRRLPAHDRAVILEAERQLPRPAPLAAKTKWILYSRITQ
jgi:hypothetical protein